MREEQRRDRELREALAASTRPDEDDEDDDGYDEVGAEEEAEDDEAYADGEDDVPFEDEVPAPATSLKVKLKRSPTLPSGPLADSSAPATSSGDAIAVNNHANAADGIEAVRETPSTHASKLEAATVVADNPIPPSAGHSLTNGIGPAHDPAELTHTTDQRPAGPSVA